MKKVQIIILNLLMIALCCYLLYEDYKRVGKFQWVDQNAIEDYEELYINVISAIAIVLGFISISTQFMLKKLHSDTPIGTVLKLVNGFYGIFTILVGGMFFLMLIGNLGNNSVNGFEDNFFLIKMFSTFILVGYLGLLILSQLLNKGRSNKTNDLHEILDSEI